MALVNLILRLDQAQLAAADAAVAWLWDRLGVPRRMLLRMALVGQFATQAAAELIVEGRVNAITLGVGAFVMAIYHLNDMRFGANPSLLRAIVLARRRTPLSRGVRAVIWALALYDLFGALGSPAWPLEVSSSIFFLVFMLGGDALPPDGPRTPRRRRAVAGVKSPAFGRAR